MNEIGLELLPKDLYTLYSGARGVLFPRVPIHPLVLQLAEEDPNMIWELIPEIIRTTKEGLADSLYSVLPREDAERALSIMGKDFQPKNGYMHLLNGVLDYHCDSVDLESARRSYDHLKGVVPEKNIPLLNRFLRLYSDPERHHTTVVYSHNLFSPPDSILHRDWAINYNNRVLEEIRRNL